MNFRPVNYPIFAWQASEMKSESRLRRSTTISLVCIFQMKTILADRPWVIFCSTMIAVLGVFRELELQLCRIMTLRANSAGSRYTHLKRRHHTISSEGLKKILDANLRGVSLLSFTMVIYRLKDSVNSVHSRIRSGSY